MKTIVLLGIMSVLSIIAYNIVGGAPRAAAQSPDRSVTLSTLADTESSGQLPARFSEYLFLHQTRYENLPVHAMMGVKACPE
jgi:hypothetical protein